MGNGDGRTFKLNFSCKGLAMLQEHVKRKLQEFMGDYTDDTLVEYVIVLLKNGRKKEEAGNDLNVFLGDDTDCFVSWLWDHLGSNLNIYIQQREAIPDDVIKVSLASGGKAGKNDTCQLGSESDKVKSDKSRPCHRREWKGLVRDTNEQPHLLSVVVDTSPKEVVKHNNVDCKEAFLSPISEVRRKRCQHDYQPTMKREDISKATIAAPRRLLQFAVRDAVAALRPSHLATEPSLKRLRSVVSTSLEDSLPGDCLTVKRSGARVSDAIVMASRVVAEAANDATKRKRSANVFDRLGHDSNRLLTLEKLELSADITEQMEDKILVRSMVSTSLEDSLPGDCLTIKQSGARVSDAIVTASRVVAEAANDATKRKRSANVFDRLGHDSNRLVTLEKLELSADITEQMEDKTFVDVMEVPTTYHQTNYIGLRARKLHGYNEMDFYPGTDYECYTNINGVAQVDLGGRGAYVGKKGISPLVRNKNVTTTAAERKPKALKGQDHPTSIPNVSCNIMTGFMNMNTWKSLQYQDSVKVLKRDGCESAKNSEAVASMPCMPFMKKRNDPVTIENERVKSNTELKKESQKIQSVVPGLCSAYAHLEDTDSRTIFVNNVHFASTKDSLSRHFNKFGEVLKVVILTDAATGQPKGSAYVEFMKKESADHALSLDGTSFMSRILKVVKKGSIPPPEATVTPWSQGVGRIGSFSASSKFGGNPVPRGGGGAGGVPSACGAHLPLIKPRGARSMQWKRAMVNPRGMTYIRSGQKTN